MKDYLKDDYLKKMDAYWRATNYLSAAQLYLLDNPLLKEPLKREHVKKKIVGHWGTVPGQNFVYVHMNRAIKKYDLDMIYVSGPGHGGNFFVSNAYLEGTYSEVYPNVGQDKEGLTKLCTSAICYPFLRLIKICQYHNEKGHVVVQCKPSLSSVAFA